MSRLVFEGLHALGEFTEFLESRAAAIEMAELEAGKVITEVLYEKAMGVFGDNTKLADLAQSTQDERTRLGYSANNPLKRDGSLLADNVEKASGPGVGAIGSREMVQLYSETGFVNARSGTSVPPRPVFRIALEESQPAVIEIANAIAGVGVGAPVEIIKSIK